MAAIAGQDIDEGVAGTVNGGRSGQGQVFEIRPQRIGDTAQHRISSIVQISDLPDNDISDIIHHVGIITKSSFHGVGAQPPIQPIVAKSAGERILAIQA